MDTANYPYWINMMQDPSVNFYKTQRAFEIYWTNRSVQKGDGWKVFKRWEWLASHIIDSAGNFPDASLQYNDLMQKIKDDDLLWDVQRPGLGAGTVACKTQGDWKSIGPTTLPVNNTGQINGMGRVNSIALHPTDSNIIFVGAAAGGIWKSTNGGISWSVYSDSLPTLGVSAIAINPRNTNIMYFGSGDRDNSDASGYGVFKSYNAGGKWIQRSSGLGNRTVSKLIIDPVDTSTILAACNGGIYRSTNGGGSWTQTYNGGFFKDIVFKPNNSDVVYASKDGLLYRSTDNGVNWSQLSNGIPTSAVTRAVIEVNALDPSLVYYWIANGSVHKGFYLSRDSGTSFRTQSTTPNIHDYSTTGSGSGGQAWYNMDMVSDPGNAGIIYCGGVNVFRSSDTGKTWTIAGYWVNQIHADQHELVAHPVTKNIFAGNDGGLYMSRNKGSAWIPLKSGLGIAQIYRMSASRTKKDILINGYQDNGTANYNQGWYTTRGGDGMDCEVDQTDPLYSYGELYYGEIFRIYNVNTQATIARQGYTAAGSDTINESGGWVTPFSLREGDGNTMYIGYKNIWRSNNIRSGTVTWRKISNLLGGSNSYNYTETENCISNPHIFYASRSDGTFFRSDSVNATAPSWSAITQPVSGVINAIETSPSNPNTVYIGINNRVYVSNNKGSSWTQVGGNFSFNVASIVLDTSSKVRGLYAGTMGGGVWYTDSTMSNWRYFSKGLPNSVRVTDLEIYYEPDKTCNCNVIYASTYNRGTWYGTLYNDGSKKPVAKLEKYDTVICKTARLDMKDKSCYNPGRFKWAMSPGAYSYANGTDTFSASPSFNFSTAGTYSFSFMAENCNGIDTLNGIVIVGDTVKSASCTPTTTNNVGGLGIFSVEMAGVSRSSGSRSQEGPYVNVSCGKIFKVKKGQKYLLKVLTGTLNNEQVKAFIDFNNDGDMNDTGELVYQPAAALITHIDTVRIPLTATKGKILRMRIRSDFLSTGTNPCSNLSYGQTEDYGLYIEADNIKPKFVSDKSSICPSATVVFTDSTTGSGSTYSWNFGSNAQPASASGKGPHSVKYSSAGYKTVTLTVDGILYRKDSAVRVLVRPDANISFTKGDSSLCRKKPFTLRANDVNSVAATYQWRLNGSNIPDSTFANYRIGISGFADSGMYSVIVSSSGLCRDTAFQRMRIRHLPVSSFSINDSTQCKNGNAFVFTNSSSIAVGSYTNTWYTGDGNSSSSTSHNYTYNAYGNYTVKLKSTSNYNCVDSSMRIVQVYASPVASFTVSPSAQCFRGHSFSFSNGSNIPAGTYTNYWTFGDGSNSGSASPPAKKYSVFDTVYQIKLSLLSNNGCTDSVIRKVYLYAQPKANFSISDSTQCLKNNSFTFTNSGTILYGSYTSFWNFGNSSTSSNSSPVYTYPAAGNYSVRQILTSNNSCRDTISRNVYVYHQPVASFTENDTFICLRNNLFVFDNNSSISQGSFSNYWTFGDGNSSTSTNVSHSYNSAGVYRVKLEVTSNNLCVDSTFQNVYVLHQPTASFSINDSNQCLKGNSFKFTNLSSIPQGSITSTWSFGDTTQSTINNPTKVYTSAGGRMVRLIVESDRYCIDSTFVSVDVFHQPKADFSINFSTQCFKGNHFIFTNNSTLQQGSFSSVWDYGNGNVETMFTGDESYLVFGTYYVSLRITSNNGCTATMAKPVNVDPSPVAGIGIDSSENCKRSNAIVFSDKTTNMGGNHNVVWDLGDASTSTQKNFTKKYNSDGKYRIVLIATSNLNCSDTATADLRIWPNPAAGFNVNDNDQCLIGNSFSFTNSTTVSAGSLSYKWLFGDGDSSGNANTVKSYAVIDTFNLKMIALSSLNCADTAVGLMITRPHPTVRFTILDAEQCRDSNNFSFINQSTIIYGINNSIWHFGDNDSSALNNPNHSYKAAGAYKVVLKSVSNYGCTDTVSRMASVLANPSVSIQINGDTTFCQGDSVKLTAVGAQTYKWNTGSSMQSIAVKTPGNYFSTGTGSNLCRAVSRRVLVSVNPLPAKPLISKTGIDSLASSYAAGNQWYRNDSAITGANGRFYKYTSNGIYRVVYTDANGCRNSSDTIQIRNHTKLRENVQLSALRVYPNPSEQFITVEFGESFSGVIELYDALGRKVKEQQIEAGEKVQIDISDLSRGVYHLQIEGRNFEIVKM